MSLSEVSIVTIVVLIAIASVIVKVKSAASILCSLIGSPRSILPVVCVLVGIASIRLVS